MHEISICFSPAAVCYPVYRVSPDEEFICGYLSPVNKPDASPRYGVLMSKLEILGSFADSWMILG
jgi:hypothetical protein